jgi:large subunit ribosomal protein L43
MNAFIRSSLSNFAKANPQIEIRVSPRPNQHPVMIGHYVNGRKMEVCVRNMDKEAIRTKAWYLRNTSGEKEMRTTKPVTSTNESVRGIWSPFHGAKIKI